MQKDEALHLKFDIRIKDDFKSVKSPGPGCLKIVVKDLESVFYDSRGCLQPESHHVLRRQSPKASFSHNFVTTNRCVQAATLVDVKLSMEN